MWKVLEKYFISFLSLLIMSAFALNKIQFSELDQFLSDHGYRQIDLNRNKAGHLTLNAKVNGIEGLFILDTGAGGTVIDSAYADTLKLKLEIDSAKSSGGGAGGNRLQVVPSKGNTMELNDLFIENFTLSVMNLGHVASAYKQLGISEKFFGVIGVDLLEPHKAVIDYSNMKLWLK